MSAFLVLVRRSLAESRWLLGLSCLALFGMSWLSVYRTARVEALLRGDIEGPSRRVQGFLLAVGGPNMDMSSAAIEALTLYWLFLLIPILLTSLWAVSRGAGAVAGELERGTMDLVLSRPVSRPAYLGAQVASALLGFAALVLSIVAGNVFGGMLHHVETPPAWSALFRPALNLVLVGLAIYGYTLLLSSIDLVRWRPLVFASALTLLQFIALAVANQPEWEEWRWLNHASVFSAFQPIEAAVKGRNLAWNAAILGGIGLAGVVPAFLAFRLRDLPAGGG